MTSVVVVGSLAVYHLWAVGLPVFADTVEISRFDFTSSGFFGLPGRMYLFGVPLIWIITTASAQARGIPWRRYRPWRLASFVYLLTATLSGFKSGLMSMVVTMTIIGVLISGRELRLRTFARKYWWAALVPVGYGLAVASSYASTRSSGLPLWRSLANRVFVEGVQPKQYAIEDRLAAPVQNGFLNDFHYSILKYTGQGTDGMFTVERSISAQIYGGNPSSSDRTVPVTVGGFAESHFTLGLTFCLVFMFLIGLLLSRLQRGNTDWRSLALRGAVLYGVYLWLIRGGLAYYAINVGVMCVAILVLVSVAGWFTTPGIDRSASLSRSSTRAQLPGR